MEVRVIRTIRIDTKTYTFCETEFGNVSLLWIGDAPIQNEIYDIELEASQVLTWNTDITLSNEGPSIFSEPDGITIVGDLDSLDLDGYMTLRLGKSIIAFMTKGVPFNNGMRIKVKLDLLQAYPIIY